MKWKLRKRIKRENQFGFYEPQKNQVFINLYSTYIQFIKETIREKLKQNTNITTKEEIKNIINLSENKMDIFVKKNQNGRLLWELKSFINRIKNERVKLKDLRYNENFNELTNFILKLLHKRLSFIHPNNISFYEKIIRKEIIKWKQQEQIMKQEHLE